MRAAITADRPTVPQPNTATLSCGPACSTLTTVPMPVCTPQASGAMSSGGRSSSRRTALVTDTTAWLANEDWAKKCPVSGWPRRLTGELPSTRVPSRLKVNTCWQ